MPIAERAACTDAFIWSPCSVGVGRGPLGSGTSERCRAYWMRLARPRMAEDPGDHDAR